MNPKLSIIVPVYKVVPYLKKCIDSILSQTFSDFELILVNDGSPDKCGEICDQYAKHDSRIKVIHKNNGGISSARNAGIEAAKGYYIGFVDSDDFIHANMYRILFETAIKHSADIAVCDFKYVNMDEVIDTQKNKCDLKVRNFTNIEALRQMFANDSSGLKTGAGNNIGWVVLWNKIYKREIFENLRFEEGRICEDELLIHKILFYSRKTIYISTQLYYYVQRPNSIIRSPYSLKRFADKVYALKDRSEFFLTIKEFDLHYKAYKSYMESFFWNYYTAKKDFPYLKQELKQLKRDFNKSLIYLIKNPLIGWKQKFATIGFIINPFIYDWLIKLEKNIKAAF
ncbi:glycosyltransferase [Bacillus sp. USDA818B3_A]|uniref:glycosyltransferase n=1 Tax=Bacillus sp. USDA818B3_A TaxID=2698834 RepID=UPI001371F55C|nr:glycosyltransferase [Bacillus sp. USDA818B3_A]